MKKQHLLVISFLMAVTTIWLSPAKALNVQMPAEWATFPTCADAEATQMCIYSFQVDDDNNGNFEDVASDDSLTASAYLFDIKDNDVASMAIYFYNGGNQDLSPRIESGDQIQVAINTRDWRPNPQAFSTAKIDSFRQEEIDGEWITHATITAKTFTLPAQGGGVMDQAAQADIIMWGDEYRDAYSAAFDGMWTSSNAAITSSPYYDSTAMTWTIDTSGPALNEEGNPNVAYFNAFFPDTAIISAYGADPVSMVGIFKVLRKDGTQTVEQEVVISRVEEPIAGILIEIPAYSFSSNDVIEAPLSLFGKRVAPFAAKKYRHPSHVIKPNVKLLSAPSLQSAKASGKKAVLKGSRVSSAKSYQGVCIKGAKLKYATGKNPNVTVQNLTKGNWSCRIRGVKKVGGKWSNAINVKIS